MSNLPLMQGIGELMAAGRSRSPDTGEKMVQMFDALAKQYTNFLYTGTPGVGISNSTLMAHIERLIDPTRSNTKSPEMNTPPGLRAFYEARQRVMSRIPGLSENVPPMLDNLGRESVVRNRGLDYWANWSPIVQATEGRSSEVDEILASLNFGIANPSETWDGVRLSSGQINRFKRLYGQEILDEGMNLEQRIPYELKRAEADAKVAGEPYLRGDRQNLISSYVERYRSMAKFKMVGGPDGEADEDGGIEFPDLSAAMQRNRDIERTYGR
jgi:hypothetical protein